MAKNQNASELIEELVGDANFFELSKKWSDREQGLRCQGAANLLTIFTDTLKRIARNQGGVPSHEAQEVLAQFGMDWTK